jgi:hypothetical protein
MPRDMNGKYDKWWASDEPPDAWAVALLYLIGLVGPIFHRDSRVALTLPFADSAGLGHQSVLAGLGLCRSDQIARQGMWRSTQSLFTASWAPLRSSRYSTSIPSKPLST